VVPPLGEAVALPLVPPLQNRFVPVADAVNKVGCERTTLADAVHDLESVTVTVYVPADKPDTVEVVCPLFQL